jgi:hypothetical protein
VVLEDVKLENIDKEALKKSIEAKIREAVIFDI